MLPTQDKGGDASLMTRSSLTGASQMQNYSRQLVRMSGASAGVSLRFSGSRELVKELLMASRLPPQLGVHPRGSVTFRLRWSIKELAMAAKTSVPELASPWGVPHGRRGHSVLFRNGSRILLQPSVHGFLRAAAAKREGGLLFFFFNKRFWEAKRRVREGACRAASSADGRSSPLSSNQW